MKTLSLQLPLSAILSLSTLCAHAASVNLGDQLTINSGINGEFGVISGSYFAADTDGNSLISGFEKAALHQGTEGFIIGVIQGTGTPTHGGAPYETDWNRITAPYTWFGNTGQEYTTSPVTGSTEAGLDFSGFNWPWNGIEDIPFGTGAWGDGFTDGIANFAWDGVYGHDYTLDYRTSVPIGDPSGLGGVQFEYHFEGTVVSAVPIPAAVWLFATGLITLLGFAKRKYNI